MKELNVIVEKGKVEKKDLVFKVDKIPLQHIDMGIPWNIWFHCPECETRITVRLEGK